MAPSSLKGQAGFGVYTTRDIAQGEEILSGPPGTPDGPTVAIMGGDQVDQSPDLQLVKRQMDNVFGHYC